MDNKRIQEVKVKCLCKKVELKFIELDPNFTVCHCDTCQLLHSGPGYGASCNDVKVLAGKESIKEWHTTSQKEQMKEVLKEQVKESEIPEYFAVWHFCAECGTKLYYKFRDSLWKNKNDKYIVSVGLLHKTKELAMVTEAFYDMKPHYYSFKEKTEKLSTDETREKYIIKSQET